MSTPFVIPSDIRKEFEEWRLTRHPNPDDRRTAFGYCDAQINRDWILWQAAFAAGVKSSNASHQEEEADRVCVESDGCPTEKSVLQRFWRAHKSAGA